MTSKSSSCTTSGVGILFVVFSLFVCFSSQQTNEECIHAKRIYYEQSFQIQDTLSLSNTLSTLPCSQVNVQGLYYSFNSYTYNWLSITSCGGMSQLSSYAIELALFESCFYESCYATAVTMFTEICDYDLRYQNYITQETEFILAIFNSSPIMLDTSFSLLFALEQRNDNDFCENPKIVFAGDVVVGTLDFATASQITCSAGYAEVWYVYTPGDAYTMIASLQPQWEGWAQYPDEVGLTLVRDCALLDDCIVRSTIGWPTIIPNVDAMLSYYISVFGSRGLFSLSIQVMQPYTASNNLMCTTATPITQTSTSGVIGFSEPGTALPCMVGSPYAWYTFTTNSVSNLVVYITLCDYAIDFDAGLALFDACEDNSGVSPWECLTYDESSCKNPFIVYPVRESTGYYLAVTGNFIDPFRAAGSYVISLFTYQVDLPANTHPDDSMEIQGGDYVTIDISYLEETFPEDCIETKAAWYSFNSGSYNSAFVTTCYGGSSQFAPLFSFYLRLVTHLPPCTFPLSGNNRVCGPDYAPALGIKQCALLEEDTDYLLSVSPVDVSIGYGSISFIFKLVSATNDI